MNKTRPKQYKANIINDKKKANERKKQNEK